MAAHRNNVLVFRIDLGQTFAEPPHQCVNRLLGDASILCVWPNRPHDVVPHDDPTRPEQDLQQTILLSRKRRFERLPVDEHAMASGVKSQAAG